MEQRQKPSLPPFLRDWRVFLSWMKLQLGEVMHLLLDRGRFYSACLYVHSILRERKEESWLVSGRDTGRLFSAPARGNEGEICASCGRPKHESLGCCGETYSRVNKLWFFLRDYWEGEETRQIFLLFFFFSFPFLFLLSRTVNDRERGRGIFL